jgi:creatinine amidohydrolase/Fe(II)-dependent formamide hydrolase-like protein
MPNPSADKPPISADIQGTLHDDPLAVLEVFDRLEIGPVKLEPQRLVAPYRLVWDGKDEETKLIYRYEEKVFDPLEPESVNLANMIAAQVALNYGLFCRRIVFHGVFDEADQRFIRDMAENTAREIYVKKFLEPNPFLVGDAAHLPEVKRETYLRAALQFPESDSRGPKFPWRFWPTDRNRHAILSSGGKDSLLSFGLMDEIGCDIHPIFVNESGRHWFTALNAYRHFKQTIPNTSRVWVNSDRIFAWMLQRMPFIRKNFADVRSDEYPVRLWTVAVFLFGVLPLIRSRNIGRLLIGDEYDTTVCANHNGVEHYNGLFDQSRYFDDALSRYFLQKGWFISQFSVLRPLSELLIQKILAVRYPHLQENQISCHAAHQEKERIKPCGKCEKCRRIVGMLSAIGVDPRQCGYSDSKIQNCLENIARKGISQEQAGFHQLMTMLLQRGLIEPDDLNEHHFKAHPEILNLRFHSAISPVNSIPVNLRKPLYRICLEHADGAVRYHENRWVNMDPITDQDMSCAYPFEIDIANPSDITLSRSSSGSGQSSVWGELTSPEVRERIRRVNVALLPVGSIEQHGPHLPLDTDAFDADYLARRVAEACSDPKPLVLPLISFGVSYHHDDFKGTLSVSNDALSRFVYEIGMNAARNGIKKLVIINAHGGNGPALNYAAQMINRDAGIFVCVDTGETSDVDIDRFIETPNDVHAGEIETSTALAVRPDQVRMDKARRSVPKFSSRYLNFTSKRAVMWYGHTHKISASGVMGDPTRASAEKGQKIWEIMLAHLVALVEDLKIMAPGKIN